MLEEALYKCALLPFEACDTVAFPFVYPRLWKESVVPIPDHALRKIRRLEGMNHELVEQNQFLLREIEEQKRQHQREMDEREARHRKKARELRRQLSYTRMRQGGQH